MTRLTLRKIAMTAGLALGSLGVLYPAFSFADSTQTSTQTTANKALMEQVYTAFFNTPGLEPNDIKVKVEGNGVVTLSGTVHNQAQVPLAEKVAAGVSGVTQVQNHLTSNVSARNN